MNMILRSSGMKPQQMSKKGIIITIIMVLNDVDKIKYTKI